MVEYIICINRVIYVVNNFIFYGKTNQFILYIIFSWKFRFKVEDDIRFPPFFLIDNQFAENCRLLALPDQNYIMYLNWYELYGSILFSTYMQDIYFVNMQCYHYNLQHHLIKCKHNYLACGHSYVAWECITF